MPKECVLVAGVNPVEYDKVKDHPNRFVLRPLRPGEWRGFSLTRAKRLHEKHKDAQLVLFDFFLGTREAISFGRDGRPRSKVEEMFGTLVEENYRCLLLDPKRLVPPAPKLQLPRGAVPPPLFYFSGVSDIDKGPVTLADYQKRFYGGDKEPSDRGLSIADVYRYICGVGMDRPGSIVALEFFSHAFQSGPVFVNTVDSTPKGLPERDPLDRDGRIKDFRFADMLDATPDSFRDAFASGAAGMVWGCLVWQYFRELARQFLAARRTGPNKDFQFTWRELKQWLVTRDEFHVRLEGEKGTGKSKKFSAEDVLRLFRDGLRNSYMQALANGMNGPVLGALPGTYTDYDKENWKGGKLMHVPQATSSTKESTSLAPCASTRTT